MKSSFPDIFILLIDTVLSDSYDNPIPREDYILFFEWFDRKLARKPFDDPFNTVEINNHNEREKWGRINWNNKMQWRLNIILSTLIDKNIINSTGYLPNKHSRWYYYSEALLNQLDYSSFSIVFEEINEKIYHNLKKNKASDDSDPQYELLMSERFQIDINKCKEWILDAYRAGSISKQSCIVNIRRVSDIYYKQIFCVTIDNGRVYTSFNSLKKELRQFCTIDGETLFNFDLKSSQPYLLASYLKEKYSYDADVQEFYRIVTEGDIYLWLLEKNNLMFDNKLNSREETKPFFYRFLFKKTNRGFTEAQKILETYLPSLYERISHERRELLKKGNHLANLLQSIEAELFIPICIKYANEGVLSVHDSLYYKSGFISTGSSSGSVSMLGAKVLKELKNSFREKGFQNFKINNN